MWSNSVLCSAGPPGRGALPGPLPGVLRQIRGNAVFHLQQLDTLDAIDSLTALAMKFKEDYGHFPESWDELVEKNLIPGAPLDPTGVPFVINPWQKSVEVSIRSTLSGTTAR